jgi:hypothetical protein
MSKKLDKSVYYVYKTMMTGSDKYYIGRRKSKHDDPMKDKYFGSGKWVRGVKDKAKLFKVVLAVFDNIEDCKAEELRLILEHIDHADNMNMARSSDGAAYGEHHPNYGKCGVLHQNYGMIVSTKTRKKLSDSAKRVIRTPEHCKNIAISKYGENAAHQNYYHNKY